MGVGLWLRAACMHRVSRDYIYRRDGTQVSVVYQPKS